MFSSRILAGILACWLTLPALAQKDTAFITTRQETGVMAPQTFLSEYDRAFGTAMPAKWMFKTDMAGMVSSFFSGIPLNLGVEYKITPALSVGVDYTLTTGSIIRDNQSTTSIQSHLFSGNLRWYYNMKRRMAAGKSASNFSGNYIGLESGWYLPIEQEYTSRAAGLGLKFGLQRRFLRYGYFDVSYGIRADHIEGSVFGRERWSFSTQPKIAMGFALFRGNKRQEGELGSACDVLKCFREERRMFKIDLYNLLSATSVPGNYKGITFNPAIDYEQKLGRSPFSVSLGYSMALSRSDINQYTYKGIISKFDNIGTAELRWYFLQKRNILMGKSGNNLSGLFAGLQSAYEFGRQWPADAETTFRYRYKNNSPSLHGVIGIQQRIFDHGFIQFKLGFGQTGKFTYISGDDIQERTDIRERRWNLRSEVKAGLAF